MIMAGSSSCFTNGVPPPQNIQMYTSSHLEDMISSSIEATSTAAAASESVSGNFLYNLSILKDKIHQVQSLANFFISPNDHSQQPYESTAIAIASIGTLIQEIIVTASSVMYTCQQMTIGNNSNNSLADDLNTSGGSWGVKDLDPSSMNQDFNGNRVVHEDGQGFYMSESLDWCRNDGNRTAFNNTRNITPRVSGNNNNNSVITKASQKNNDLPMKGENLLEEKNPEGLERNPITNYDIVELNAADILAKYTHYCHVCGKGFKRDANLRMHMRAHGDEYKSNAALSNPVKNINRDEGKSAGSVIEVPRKYSCPHEGCRWNKKHAKFQPLKSMICVKNHYKRSHCPKMYVCKRCNRKQFSVLSDLRTHEKHCGDLKWQCSCGTTFSRKDKLMGHVALFVGHTPAISSLNKMGKVD